MRSLIFELRPAELESDGLLPTLQKHVAILGRLTNSRITLRDDGYAPQPPGREQELFRIMQEALNNATRHAGAANIEIAVGGRDGAVRMTVADDGVGFDPNDPGIRARRLGLTSMTERAEDLGGTLTIESTPGAGTRIEVEVPVG
jgi:signal transduction histidine kinase